LRHKHKKTTPWRGILIYQPRLYLGAMFSPVIPVLARV
jgi:hypothetical protein